MIDLADLIENRMPEGIALRARNSDFASNPFALNRQRYKVVLSLREDFLPALEVLKRTIPSIMRNRQRLLPMTAAQAFDAVHRTAPHLADEAMTRSIVSFVAGRDLTPDATTAAWDSGLTQQVEPALLSVVCEGLNERRKAQQKAAFDAELVTSAKTIVEEFYRVKMADMPARVHRFIEEQLINQPGFRKSCDRDDARRVHRVEDHVLQLLVDRRLLRIEPGRGTERVELMHDLLTKVVRKHRDLRRDEEHRSKEQRRRWKLIWGIGALILVAVASSVFALTALSLKQTADDKSTAALESAKQAQRDRERAEKTLKELQNEKEKVDKAIEQRNNSQESEAKALRRAEDLARTEQESRIAAQKATLVAEAATANAELDKSKALDSAATAERLQEGERQAKTTATENATNAELARSEAERLRNIAVAHDLASRAQVLQRPEDLRLATELAIRAFVLHSAKCQTSAGTPCPADLIVPNLHTALQTTLNRLTQSIHKDAYGADGIVTKDAGGAIMRVMEGKVILSARPSMGALRIDLPAGWNQFGVAAMPKARPVVDVSPTDRLATAVTLARSGLPMAQGRRDGTIDVWADDGPPAAFSVARDITALAFSPDSKRIAAAGAGGLLLFRPEPGELIGTPKSFPHPVRALLFDPGGRVVLIATSAGIFTSDKGEALAETKGYDVRSMAFSDDGYWFAYGDRKGVIRLGRWNPESSSAMTAQLGDSHLSSVTALTFSPNGELLASGGADGSVRLFQLGPRSGGAARVDRNTSLPAVLEGHSGPVDSLVFSDDTLLYSGGSDGTLRVWLTRMDAMAALLCRDVKQDKLGPLRASDEATVRSLLPRGQGGPANGEIQNLCSTVDRNLSSAGPPRVP